MNIKNKHKHKDDTGFHDIIMISNNDILGISSVVSGLVVIGVGTQTLKFFGE